MTVFRKLAVAYAILVGLVACWAWYVDVRLLHSTREHLAPDLVLLFMSLPASLSLPRLCETWPTLFSRPLAQLAWLTLCGAGQAAVLFLVTGLAHRARRGGA